MKKIITTKDAPKAIGPYSQAIEFNGMLFVSGQIPINPDSGNIEEESIASQTKRVLHNLEHILQEAGFTLQDVVKTTCFLQDMNDFQSFNEVYDQFFNSGSPARSAIEVSALPRGALIKIEAIAAK
ncbi:MAG: hypothetical protein GVY19_09495 [Bacteroidetes bacterium]|jgi:2-iminobutanoate/2-iminopropanoate deaminase|nr:hypothetical protein [Bacteroidota bacterium]